MEQKEFSVKQIAAFKRIAANVYSVINKKNTLEAKKAAIEEELKDLYEEIELMDAPVRKKTGGYGIEDLFVKTIFPTGKLDAKGNVLKATKYELRYPDTFYPPVSMEDSNIDSVDDSPVEETETSPNEASYNPIENTENY